MADSKLEKIRPIDDLIGHLQITDSKLWWALKVLSERTLKTGAISSDQLSAAAKIVNNLLQIQVNEIGVTSLADFNDNLPATPLGFYQVFFQNSGSKISAYAAISPNISNAKCAIIGGLIKATNGGTSSGGYMPFASSGSSGLGNTGKYILPTGCWIFNLKIFLGTTETGQSLTQLALEQNSIGGSTTTGLIFMFNIPILATGPAVYHGGSKYPRFEFGDRLRLLFQNGGIGANSGYQNWSACIYSDNGDYPLGTAGSTLAAGNTVYYQFGGYHGSTAEVNARIVLAAGTLKKMLIQINAQNGSMTDTVTVFKNGIATGLTITIPSGASSSSVYEIDSNVTFNGTTDTFSIQEIAGAGTGTAADKTISFLFTPTALGTAFIPFCFSRAPVSGITAFINPWDQSGSGVYTLEWEAGFPMPRGGTIKASNCLLYLATAKNPADTTTIKLRKNGADSGISWVLTNATLTGPVQATGADVTILENDYINLSEGGTGSTGLISSARIILQ